MKESKRYHRMKKFLILGLTCLFFTMCKTEETKQLRQIPSKNRIAQGPPAHFVDNPNPVNYKLRDEKSHLVNIVCELSAPEMDSLIIFLYKFNREKHSGQKFSVSHSPLFGSEERKLITISSLANKAYAMTYYGELMESFNSHKTYQKLPDQSFIIHNYNSRLLLESKSLDSYYTFFANEYLEVSPDSMRNNFDESSLYSTNDTSGFYVCIKTDGKIDSDGAKKSISEYNKLHYPGKGLRVLTLTPKEQSEVFVYRIGRFELESDAYEYYQQLIGLFADIEQDIFVISQKNFFTMFMEESIEDYLEFYNSTYKSKLESK